MKPNLRLKHERELRGWSQAKVAEEIDSSEKNVSRWERGVSSPQPIFRERLCRLFGKSAQELGFVGDESYEPPAVPSVIEQQVLAQSLPYGPTIPPLPNEGRGLVGRQELLDTLLAQVCAGKSVALSGLPGVGKTALVATLVHHPRVLETFCDGVLWAGLGPHPDVLEQLSRFSVPSSGSSEKKDSSRPSGDIVYTQSPQRSSENAPGPGLVNYCWAKLLGRSNRKA